MKIYQQLLVKKKTVLNLKKSLDWRKTIEVILKKNIWLKKVKVEALIKLLDTIYDYKTMLSYCLKYRENTKNINSKISGTTNDKKSDIIKLCYMW